MTASLFKNYPIVKYRNAYVRNIILRAAFIRQVLDNSLVFFPHIVLEGQTAENIAYDYYGDCDLDFLIWMANGIIDPYYEWTMSEEMFNAYITKKYGRFEEAVETIHHYEYDKDVLDNDPNTSYTADYQLTPETYSFFSTIEKSYWRPVSCYDYEFRLNEAKRTIQVLDNRLLDQVLTELAGIMK